VWPESCNLHVCWAGLHGACSRGNTKCTIPLGFGGVFGDIHANDILNRLFTTDMKNRTLQGGDSYPGCLAGVRGGQLISRHFTSEVRSKVKFSSEIRNSEVKSEEYWTGKIVFSYEVKIV
jgi:hypothetical protein